MAILEFVTCISQVSIICQVIVYDHDIEMQAFFNFFSLVD